MIRIALAALVVALFAGNASAAGFRPTAIEEPSILYAPPLARAFGHAFQGVRNGFHDVGTAVRGFGASAMASFYGHGERLNKRTATGEVFRPMQLTAAHRTLPLGTRIRVAFAGREVVVRINDRGPARYTGRDLDLSSGAARAIGLDRAGVARVSYTVVD